MSTGVTVTTSSSVRTAIGSVGTNLITSVKSVTTLEAPKNPVVKPFIKPKQGIETVKQPAVTSEKPKTVEKSHSQGSNNHNSNKESFNQKTEENTNKNYYDENFKFELSGKGNTGRQPENLNEQLTMEEIMSDPLKGEHIENLKLKDKRWKFDDGWEKWKYRREGLFNKPSEVEIHYLLKFKKNKLIEMDDFKVK